jgi:hypothetical protein
MAASVPRALGRIKSDLRSYLPDEAIEGACRDAGHAWRERKLGPAATVHLFVLQVLWFNTAMAHLRHLAGHALSAGAYCRARMRLPLSVLQRLLRDSSAAMRAAPAAQAGALWHGLRAYLVDASSTITPDVPGLRGAFGQPAGCKPGCGFPVPKLLALFDAFTGLVVELIALPLYTHEQSNVWRLHPLLSAGDLLVGDCGFCSFVHLAMLRVRGAHACFTRWRSASCVTRSRAAGSGRSASPSPPRCWTRRCTPRGRWPSCTAPAGAWRRTSRS